MSQLQRVAATNALITKLRNASGLAGVTVFFGGPRDDLVKGLLAYVWCAPGDGTIEIPAMRAGRKTRDDRFTIDVWTVAYVEGAADGATAAAAAEVLAGAVESAIADDVKLTGSGLDFLISLTVTNLDGPVPSPTDTGYGAALHFQLTAWLRYQ